MGAPVPEIPTDVDREGVEIGGETLHVRRTYSLRWTRTVSPVDKKAINSNRSVTDSNRLISAGDKISPTHAEIYTFRRSLRTHRRIFRRVTFHAFYLPILVPKIP